MSSVEAGFWLLVVASWLLLAASVWMTWLLRRHLPGGEEKEMEKKGFEGSINTPLGSAGAVVSGSEAGLEAGVSAAVRPDFKAAASGAGGAMAYNWVAGMAGAWTPALLVALGAGVWIYQRQRAKKAGEAP